MGRPKGLLPLGGRPLILHHVVALEPFTRQLVAVIGAEAEAHRAVLGPDRCVENPGWQHTWPADSLRLALARWRQLHVLDHKRFAEGLQHRGSNLHRSPAPRYQLSSRE